MFARKALGALLVISIAVAACSTPVDIDWDGSSPTPTKSPASDGATWISARQVLDPVPNAPLAEIVVSWSPVAAVSSWQVLVDGVPVDTTENTEHTLSDLIAGTEYVVRVLPANALVSEPSISVTVTAMNRQRLPPFGAIPGTSLAQPVATGRCFGKSLTAAQLDSDPGDDLLVGAPWMGNGSVILYSTNRDGTFDPETPHSDGGTAARYGWSQVTVSGASETVPRIVVGAPGASGEAGKFFEWQPSGLSGVDLGGTFTLGSGALVGYSLAAADLNGDTLPELLVGGPGANGGGGSMSLFEQIDTGVFTHRETVFGPAGDELGSSVALANDVIEGIDFALAGAPGAGSTAGRVHVESVDANGFDGLTLGDVFGGTQDRMGASCIAAGDVTGDGKPDLIGGAPGTTSLDDGFVQIVLGSDDFDLGQQLGKLVTVARPGFAGGQRFGGQLVSLGDVTYDGVSDFLVTATNLQYGTGPSALLNAGGVFLYEGSAVLGTGTAFAWGATGTFANGYFGASAAIGHFDTDTHPDLAIGAASCDVEAGTSIGQHEAVHVFYSPPDSGPRVSPSGDVFTGAPGLAVSFDHVIDSLGIGGTAECTWNWDDGLGDDPTGPCALLTHDHVWPAAGQYEPVLMVRSSYGLRTSTSFLVVIE